MTNIILDLDARATKAMGSNTRLRVKLQKRKGQELLGLRSSYRVSGKNAMVRLATVGTDGASTAVITPELMSQAGVTIEEGQYFLKELGYQWFGLVKDVADTVGAVAVKFSDETPEIAVVHSKKETTVDTVTETTVETPAAE